MGCRNLRCESKSPKLSETFAALCPLGYNYHNGGVSGWGSISGQAYFEELSLTFCKWLCESKTDCCSFEWSPTSRMCNLNKELDTRTTCFAREKVGGNIALIANIGRIYIHLKVIGT